jgi:pimeloyl-ACP methyl ester carboxylesterase
MRLSQDPRHAFVTCISPAGLHRMAYQEWGDPANPRVVVCVHGLTRISDDFSALALALHQDYRVICPDVVGRGRSSWLADPRLYGIAQYTSDMVTLIARLGVAHVDWVGTSMGGLIGMTLAGLPDTPVQRLVMNDVGAELSGQALSRIATYVGVQTHFETLEEARRKLKTIFAGFGPHTEPQWDQLIQSVLVPLNPNEGVGWRVHYDPAIAEPFRLAYGSQLDQGETPADMNLWPLYESVRCPTLLLRGQESDLLTEPVFQAMQQRGPKAKAVAFEGVGHAPSLMHDHQIQVVRDFLLNASPPDRSA